MKRILLIGVFFLCGPGTTASVHASGSEGAAFLDIPVGARPAALGSAYTSLADDAYAPVWNPAGLGLVSHTQVAAQHLSYLESINYEYISAVHKIGTDKALGVSVQYLGSGDIAGTAPDGQATGDYSVYYGAYSAAYGQKLNDKLSLGLTGKWINAKLSDVSGNAFAVDLGSMYAYSPRLNLAMTLTNLGSSLKFNNEGDSLPCAVHLAASYRPLNRWLVGGEAVYSMAGLLSGRFGLEWMPLDMMALRTGYKTETTQELSALAGFTTGIGLFMWGQELDYAWLPYGELGDTHYLSLVMHFGKTEGQKNLIQYQTIKQERRAERKGEESTPDYEQFMKLLSGEGDSTAETPKQPAKPVH